MLAHVVWPGLFEVESNMVFDNVHVKGRASTGISLALLARRCPISSTCCRPFNRNIPKGSRSLITILSFQDHFVVVVLNC